MISYVSNIEGGKQTYEAFPVVFPSGVKRLVIFLEICLENKMNKYDKQNEGQERWRGGEEVVTCPRISRPVTS
jgi:hypothetical protein